MNDSTCILLLKIHNYKRNVVRQSEGNARWLRRPQPNKKMYSDKENLKNNQESKTNTTNN